MENNPNPAPTPEPAPVAPAPAPAAEQPLFANNGGGAPKKSHTGLIVGIILGIIVIATVLVVLFAVILPNMNKEEDKDKKDNGTSQQKDPEPEPEPEPTPTPTPTPTPISRGKTLVCSQTQTGTGTRTSVSAEFSFDESGTLTKVLVIEEDWKESGFTDAEIQAAQKETNTYYSADRYTSWNVRRKDAKTVILEAELKLSEENIANIDSYEKAKAQFGSNGYDCE